MCTNPLHSVRIIFLAMDTHTDNLRLKTFCATKNILDQNPNRNPPQHNARECKNYTILPTCQTVHTHRRLNIPLAIVPHEEGRGLP
mgnify:CR=1 FL=1